MWYSMVQPVTAEIVKNELNSALKVLPEWRRKAALSYRFDIDRYICAKAYLLLKELLLTHYGMSEDVEFEFGLYKKPLLKSFQNIHFNYSHCLKAVLCAVGDAPLGVDVEEIQYDEDISREVFSYSERQIILNAEVPSIKFTEYWTQKESYLKLIGTGLTNDLKPLLNNIHSIVDFKTEVNQSCGFVTTIATFKNNNQK